MPSVRNTGLGHAIVAKSVQCFVNQGKEVESCLTTPLRSPSLDTAEFLVERHDASGGSRTKCLVEWIAENEVTEPIIEAVMIGTKGQQRIPFAKSGRPVREVVSDKGSP